VGVDAVFTGVTPGYRLEKTAGVGAAVGAKAKKAAGWGVFWRR
jgi:hypothetical protein